MAELYKEVLKDGSELYIPTWPASVALENLTKAGEFIGTDNLLDISTLSCPAVIRAILESSTPKETTLLIKHFVCTARVDGSRITDAGFDSMFEGSLFKIAEIFAHVIKSQYLSFFELGLAKETSQDS